MAHTNQHTMQLAKEHDSGSEEWYCPTCERRFVVQWQPNYKKIILNPGDEDAFHSGGKGGVSLGKPTIQDSQQDEPMLSQIWLDAIAELDFHNMPDSTD